MPKKDDQAQLQEEEKAKLKQAAETVKNIGDSMRKMSDTLARIQTSMSKIKDNMSRMSGFADVDTVLKRLDAMPMPKDKK